MVSGKREGKLKGEMWDFNHSGIWGSFLLLPINVCYHLIVVTDSYCYSHLLLLIPCIYQFVGWYMLLDVTVACVDIVVIETLRAIHAFAMKCITVFLWIPEVEENYVFISPKFALYPFGWINQLFGNLYKKPRVELCHSEVYQCVSMKKL